MFTVKLQSKCSKSIVNCTSTALGAVSAFDNAHNSVEVRWDTVKSCNYIGMEIFAVYNY